MNGGRTRKDIIKNIAIIFLIVLLVLTFFSNTIMNYSLPEVNAQYVSEGTINEKIRGTGIAEANDLYEVNTEETRTIKSVNIKNGSEVKKGQVLFVFEDNESDELKDAQDTLDTMELEYQKALLSNALPDYTLDNLAIQNARDDLQKAIALRNSSVYSGASDNTSGNTEEYINSLNSEIQSLTSENEKFQNILTAIDTEDYASPYLSGYNEIYQAVSAVSDAESAYASAQTNQAQYESETAVSSSELQSEYTAKQRELEQFNIELERLKEDLELKGSSDIETERLISDKEYSIKYAEEDLRIAEINLNSAIERETNLKKAEAETLSAESNLNKVKADLKSVVNSIRNNISSKISDNSSRINSDTTELENIQNVQSENNTSVITYEEADEQVKAAQRTLNELLVTLSKTQKDDKLANSLAELEIESQAEKIKKQEELVAKIKEKSSETEIKSKIDGTVSQLNVSAGDKTSADTPLAVIQIADKGYSVSFSVTNEQSKKLRVGSTAEVTNVYDGEVSAVLESIKTNPDNPKEKMLTFSVTGDISPNQSLSISAGGKSVKYDTVVPKSAVREDKSGKFVLVVRAKSSPLGNRYKAYKVGVEVTASDDASSAITGNISGSDFVITASDSPIESGMLVRLAEE
jgi:multidrug efflux pump subunit AcrA (membrane-fusion protein)